MKDLRQDLLDLTSTEKGARRAGFAAAATVLPGVGSSSSSCSCWPTGGDPNPNPAPVKM